MAELNTTRINVSIENNTLARIDKFAAENGLSRSGSICIMCNEYIRQLEAERTLKALVPMMKSADGNTDIKELLEQLKGASV